MKNLMKYKNYYGSVEFDEESMIFYGKVQFIRSLISYEGETAQEILSSFHEAVDDYLMTCTQRKTEPEQSFKGSFNIRVGSKIHEEIAIKASQLNTSVNDFVKSAISNQLNSNRL